MFARKTTISCKTLLSFYLHYISKGIYIWVPATLMNIDEYQSDHRIHTSDGILCVSASLSTSCYPVLWFCDFDFTSRHLSSAVGTFFAKWQSAHQTRTRNNTQSLEISIWRQFYVSIGFIHDREKLDYAFVSEKFFRWVVFLKANFGWKCTRASVDTFNANLFSKCAFRYEARCRALLGAAPFNLISFEEDSISFLQPRST